jgi:prepilin-type N-terminal cleavage/methylation domain-containing protein
MVRLSAFTLLELLLVLTVLGLFTAVAATRMGGLRRGQEAEQAARTVVAQALRARHLAQSRGQMARLRLDDGQAVVALVSGAASADPADGQPAGMPLVGGAEALSVAFRHDDGSSGMDVLFLPDRRCLTPGQVVIVCGGTERTVRIHPGSAPPEVAAP